MYSLKFLLTNRLNQDCLENFFSIIRFKGGHRDNPDAVQFRGAYRAAAVDSIFIVSQLTNCVEDPDSFLLKLKNVTNSVPTNSDAPGTSFPSAAFDLLRVASYPVISPAESDIIVYLAGYLVKKALAKFSCCDCINIVVSQEIGDSQAHTFLKNKQFV